MYLIQKICILQVIIHAVAAEGETCDVCTDSPIIITSRVDCFNASSEPRSVIFMCIIKSNYSFLFWNGSFLKDEVTIPVRALLDTNPTFSSSIPNITILEQRSRNCSCFQSTLNITGNDLSALFNQTLSCRTNDIASVAVIIPPQTESLNEVAAHVLQPCEGTQDNMVIINLNTNKELVMVSTPFGFSCVTNECRDVSANVIGPCELEYLITVRVVNCSSNFSVSISQTKPQNGIDVCPLESVEYSCTANYDELGWYFNRTAYALYRPTGRTRDSNSTIFKTELLYSNDEQISATATIESVLIEYNGLLIECHDIGGVAIQEIKVEGAPPVPKDINIDILNTTNMELTVNLTWTLNHRCVMEYYVEVTNISTSTCITNTTSQYIVLTLKTGVVYSFRVRGVDGAGRGEWSELYKYTPGETNVTSSTATLLTTATAIATATATSAAVQCTGWIVGTVIATVFAAVFGIVMAVFMIATVILSSRTRSGTNTEPNGEIDTTPQATEEETKFNR